MQTGEVALTARSSGLFGLPVRWIALLALASACSMEPAVEPQLDQTSATDQLDTAADTASQDTEGVAAEAGPETILPADGDAEPADADQGDASGPDAAKEVETQTDAISDGALDAVDTTVADAGDSQDSSGDATVGNDVGADAADSGEDSTDTTPAGDAGGCTAACAKQDFGSPCLVGACSDGVCKGVPVTVATACEDGSPCTSGDSCCLPGSPSCQPGSCKSGKSNCECQGVDLSECESLKGDANLCNGVQVCDTSSLPYKCALKPGSAVVCPSDAGECASYSCQPATGKCLKKLKPDGEVCASGSPCADSECTAGVCTVTVKKCECATTGDCASKDNPNLCAGTYYCDKSSSSWTCKVNPATAVYCPSGADTACAKNVCLPSTGKCKVMPTELLDCSSGKCVVLTTPKQTALCEDGNPCTASDSCAGGSCKAGTVVCGCQKDGDCAAKEDGDPCNGTLYCDLKSATCKVNPVSVVHCPAGIDPCQANLCKSVGGKGICTVTAILEGQPCSDGDLCTSGDHCEKGTCTATANTCVCTKDSDCKSFDDGDACNGLMVCDVSQPKPVCVVNPATVVSCAPSDSPCVMSSCDKATGACQQTKVADGSGCDADGSSCTSGDQCQAGACKAGTPVCGCQSDSECQKFDDGNACNGTLYCDLATKACKVNPVSVIQCPTALDGPCQVNSCDPSIGNCKATPLPLGTGCEDGSNCTLGDTCIAGKCVSGVLGCGCLSDASCQAQDDGNPCNGKLICDLAVGKCITAPGSVVTCLPDSNLCTLEQCEPKSGKCAAVLVAEGSSCSDGVPCTEGDNCANGQCKAGLNLCSCKVPQDCSDDGNLCNGVPSCVSGQCQAGKNVACPGASSGCVVQKCAPLLGSCMAARGECEDNNPCTADSCDLKTTKCLHNPFGDGTVCGAAAVCIAGTCKLGPAETVVVGGSYWMGCNAAVDPQCKSDESPQHLVEVIPVAVDRFEVTVAAYAECVKSGKCTPTKADLGCNAGQPFKQDHPINCVQQAQAQAFCSSKGGRLPSEAEWELAARGPCTTPSCKTSTPRFPWGNMPLPSCLQTWMHGSVGPGCNNGSSQQGGALTEDLSVWGIFDLAGNVSEWTLDGYSASFYASAAAAKVSPVAPMGVQGTFRGGSLQSFAADIRVSARHPVASTTQGPHLGFRCVYEY